MCSSYWFGEYWRPKQKKCIGLRSTGGQSRKLLLWGVLEYWRPKQRNVIGLGSIGGQSRGTLLVLGVLEAKAEEGYWSGEYLRPKQKNVIALGSIRGQGRKKVIDLGVLEAKAEECYWSEEYWRPCLLYTSPSPRDMYKSRMPSSA